MNFAEDENGDVLRRMSDAGDDLSKPREINFSLVFSDQDSAAAFVRLARGRGWRAHTDGEAPEDATITRLMLPDHGLITAFEAELEALATPLGGLNDGWGCWQV